ncbi:hypothetical protein D3C76_1790840 [compost metagenome]
MASDVNNKYLIASSNTLVHAGPNTLPILRNRIVHIKAPLYAYAANLRKGTTIIPEK